MTEMDEFILSQRAHEAVYNRTKRLTWMLIRRQDSQRWACKGGGLGLMDSWCRRQGICIGLWYGRSMVYNRGFLEGAVMLEKQSWMDTLLSN